MSNAATASPYGFLPISLIGGQDYAGNVRQFDLISNVASAFYYGCPVGMASGLITPLSATSTTTNGTTTPLGIFVGCEYDDPVMNYRLENNYLAANAITNGYGNVKLKIVDDYDILMMIQSDGTLTNTALGKNAQFQTFTGSTVTHKSNITLISSTIATTNTFGLRIVGVADAWTNTFPDVIVKWNFGVHTYQQAQGL